MISVTKRRPPAQIPREVGKLFGKVAGKKQGGGDWGNSQEREREVDRLNRWASTQQGPQ